MLRNSFFCFTFVKSIISVEITLFFAFNDNERQNQADNGDATHDPTSVRSTYRIGTCYP